MNTNDFAQRVIAAIEQKYKSAGLNLFSREAIDIIRAEASKVTDEGQGDLMAGFIPSGFSLSEMNEFATAIHYPECWDTAAYPKVEYAVHEIVMGAGCTEHPADKPASCSGDPTFQSRVQPWMMACFGAEISADTQERNHRFLEESLELVQACGATQSEAHQLVDYVYGRPVGDKPQEVGGVMVTLAALCLAQGMDMHAAGEIELARIWTKVEKIRAKQAAKPKHSPLPEAAQPAQACATKDEWEIFEAVYRKQFPRDVMGGLGDFDQVGGVYLRHPVQNAWIVWQAARSLAGTEDAKRYQALRNADNQLHEDDISVSDSSFNTYFGEELDAAVDALIERAAMSPAPGADNEGKS